jgi:hypothetical protein
MITTMKIMIIYSLQYSLSFTVLSSDVCHSGYNSDGDPVFSLPSPAGNTISVREDSPPGAVVYSVSASDTEFYELNAAFPEFGLNGDQIVITGALDYETTKEYTLNIRCVLLVTDATLLRILEIDWSYSTSFYKYDNIIGDRYTAATFVW